MDNINNVDMWLKRAKSSLIHSKDDKKDGLYYEDLCFDCQQSAEKSLKALIVDLGLEVHKTHSFRELFKELKKRITLPVWTEDILELGQYAVMTRYPDDYREISEEEYLRAVEIAERVYNWVKDQIKY
ncbi:MAG: HEPN domain-containing protein [Spirochaetales bacterium]|nr:HEPN domain-containing protein [Spirochaetales bacterium]